MRVTISDWAWLPSKDYPEDKVDSLKDAMTIIPRRTSQHQTEIVPVKLYREKLGKIGIPREYFLTNRKMHHKIEYAMSNGRVLDLPFGGTLKEDQQNAVDVVMRDYEALGTGGIVQASPGWGKMLCDDTPILTDKGWVKNGDAKVGMRVYGADGKLHNIVGVYPQGKVPLYRMTFTDGTFVDCGEPHLWTVQRRRENGKPWVTLKTGEMIREGLRDRHGRKFFLPLVKPIEYPKGEELKIDPYTLGVMLGDGCVSVEGRVTITVPDIDVSNIERLVLPEDVTIRKCIDKRGKRCPYYALNGAKKTLYPLLSNYGLGGVSSHTKFIPGAYMRASVADRLALLQGLMDTDGTVNAGTTRFSTVSEKMANGVKEIVCSLGGTCRLSERYTRYTTEDGGKSKLFHSYRLGVKLPADMDCFQLPRKLEMVNKKRQREPYRAIDLIERVEDREATCIAVDAKDHLYVTKDFILTHNTVMGLGLWTAMKRTAVVTVGQKFLVDQWKKRIEQFVPGARVGIIQQNKCQFGDDYDISIAMMQSLVARKDSYPEELWDAFGLVISDETHRVGAKSWANVVPMFNARYRLGLTATPRRKDGCDKVFFWHIGKILYKSKTKRMTPKVRRIFTGFEFYVNGNFDPNEHSKELQMKFLCANYGRNKLIVDELNKAVRAGRKVIVLSERRKHLEKLRALFGEVKPEHCTVDFYVGGRKQSELDIAEKASVLFCTYQMTKEALDIPALDTAFLTTPYSDVEQAVGRIMREHDDKKDPVVVDFIDSKVNRFKRLWNARLRFYRKEKMFVKED